MHVQSRSFRLFIESIKSEKSKIPYTYSLHEFMRFYKIENYDEIPKFTTTKIQKLLENWVLHLKKKQLKSVTIKAKLNAVELFLDMNKVIFHKRILHKLLPSDDNIPGGEIPFTNEDIQASKQSTQVLLGVVAFVADHKFLTNWMTIEHDGWTLPCTLDKYDQCGLWITLGCLKDKLHQMLGKGNRVYIKQYQRSCYRPSCMECYLKWIARQANRATRRIEEYAKKTGQKPIHLMLMVPKSQYDLPYESLRKRMMEILKIAQWEGGSVIFHPFKFNKITRQWYYSPHFHLVGFGDRSRISRAFGRYGWYVKIGDERKSVFQTFCYLLSHCGIKKNHHTVTWIGELSYGKVPSEKEPTITCCTACGGEFVQVYYDGVHPIVPPNRHYEGLVDSDGSWKVVPRWEKIENNDIQYDYAPFRELNEILQSLAGAV